MEAEYSSLTLGCQEAMWTRQLLISLDPTLQAPTVVISDNQSAIHVASNGQHFQRRKHIDIKHYWIQHLIENHHIQLKYINTSKMIADILTKSLSRSNHQRHCSNIGFSSTEQL